jgi:hypothetical protein
MPNGSQDCTLPIELTVDITSVANSYTLDDRCLIIDKKQNPVIAYPQAMLISAMYSWNGRDGSLPVSELLRGRVYPVVFFRLQEGVR